MNYLNKNQDRNILNEIVVSKFENLPFLLDIIIKNPEITQSDLRKKSKYSGGKIYRCVNAMKSMMLATNGKGLIITDFGKLFLTSFNSDKEDFKRILKEACLNVPLFHKLYVNNNDIKDPRTLFKLFKKEIDKRYENIDSKFLGSIVRRYLDGIHNIKLRVGFKISPTEQKSLIQNLIIPKGKDNKELIEVLKNLKKTLKLSDKEFNKLINSLPEKKREEIFSQILSKVFT